MSRAPGRPARARPDSPGRLAARILVAWAAYVTVAWLVIVLAGGDHPLGLDLCDMRASHPVLASAAGLLTDTANPPVTTGIAVATCAAALLCRHLRAALVLAIVPFLATEAAAVIRAGIARRRPGLTCSVAHLHSYSFPSGHALGATIGYGLIGLWLMHAARGRWPTPVLLPLAAVWATAISWSRVALGLHYPTDVAGGTLLGIIFLLLANLILTLIYQGRPVTRNGAGRMRRGDPRPQHEVSIE